MYTFYTYVKIDEDVECLVKEIAMDSKSAELFSLIPRQYACDVVSRDLGVAHYMIHHTAATPNCHCLMEWRYLV